MEIPSALTMARKAIKENPTLLKPSFETEMILFNLMREYRDACKKYVSQDQPIIEDIKTQLQSLTKLNI